MVPAAAPPGGLDSVSATKLSEPAMCWISLVNSAMYASWLRRPADGGGERFVVRIQREPPTLQHKPEMAEGLEAGQQLSVES